MNTQLEEALECGICLEPFETKGEKIPRLLTCGHTFCTGCIKGFREDIVAASIICAVCNQKTKIPNKGLTEMTPNFALIGVVETASSLETEQSIKDKQQILQESYLRLDQQLKQAMNELPKNQGVPTSKTRTEEFLSKNNKHMHQTLTQRQTTKGLGSPGKAKFNVVIAGPSGVGKTSLGYYFAYHKSCIEHMPTQGVGHYPCETLDLPEKQMAFEMWDTAGDTRHQATWAPSCRKADAILMVFDLTNPKTLGEIVRRFRFIMSEARVTDPVVFLLGNKFDVKIPEEAKTTATATKPNTTNTTTTTTTKSAYLTNQSQDSNPSRSLSISQGEEIQEKKKQNLGGIDQETLNQVVSEIKGVLMEFRSEGNIDPYLSYYQVSAKTGRNCDEVFRQMQLQIAYRKVFSSNEKDETVVRLDNPRNQKSKPDCC